MASKDMVAMDSSAMPWEERFKKEQGFTSLRKILIQDPDTGMEVRMVQYPAGQVTPWHTHPCAHGLYVLEGTLQTHSGAYGPGHFVWFPEGMAAEHGATPEGNCTVLFITNKPFEIHFLNK